MNKDGWIGKKGFRYYYYRVRDSEYYTLGLIGITFVVCLILIFSFIVPQVKDWFSIREETLAARVRIAVLQNNISYLNNLNRNTADEQLELSTSALPTQKDFDSILNVVSASAIASGVSLSDYSFQVGKITLTPQTGAKGPLKDISTTRITVVVSGTLENVKRYMRNIQLSQPLAQVTNVDGVNSTYAIGITFYQKAFPKIVFNDDKALTALPQEKTALIERLKKMHQEAPVPIAFPDVVSSNAAVPVF